MNLDTDTQDSLLRRLARVEGQVRAVQKMITDGRECREVIAQVSAASTALDQVGFKILSVGMQRCLADPKKAGKEGFTLDEVEKLFLKLALQCRQYGQILIYRLDFLASEAFQSLERHATTIGKREKSSKYFSVRIKMAFAS